MKKIICLIAAFVLAIPAFSATFQEVNAFIKEKKWSDAEKSCRELISEIKKPADVFIAYNKLMMIMRRQNKNAELIADADAFLANCKNDQHAAAILIYKGIAQRAVKQRVESLDTFKLAVDKAKDGYSAREAAFYFIDTAPSVKKYAEAQEMYNRAAKFKGADKDARLHAAGSYAFFYDRKYDEGLAILDKLDAIENLSVGYKETSLRYRGNIFAYKKNHQEAIKCYDKALELKLDAYREGRITWFKAQSLEKLGKKAEALECYKKAAAYKGDAYFQRNSVMMIKKLEK